MAATAKTIQRGHTKTEKIIKNDQRMNISGWQVICKQILSISYTRHSARDARCANTCCGSIGSSAKTNGSVLVLLCTRRMQLSIWWWLIAIVATAFNASDGISNFFFHFFYFRGCCSQFLWCRRWCRATKRKLLSFDPTHDEQTTQI